MNSSFKNNFSRLAALFYPHKMKMFLAILSLFVTVVAILLYGFTARIFIDEGLSAGDGSKINLFFVNFTFLTVLLALSGYFRSYFINDISLEVANAFKKKAFVNSLHFKMSFFDENGHGDVVSRLNKDVAEIFGVFAKNITFFLRNVALFVGGVAFLLVTSTKLFLIMLLVIFLALLPVFLLVRRLKSFSKLSKELDSKVDSFLQESLSFVKIIKSCAGQEKAGENFAKLSDDFLLNAKSKSAMQSLIVGVAIFFAFFSVAVILYLGSLDVLSGKISAGDLSSFVFYAVILSISLVGISQSMSQILSISQSSNRVFELLDAEREDLDIGKDLDLTNGVKIEFKDVSFSYPGFDRQIIEDLNFKIKDGQKVAISGQSGTGKSSIFSLLLRFYDVSKGEILINGIDICDYNLRSLRSIFSYVMQDSFIFSGTIYENLIYPSSKISKEEIQEVISSSKAFDFVNELPNGIDSDVGSVGSKLSGGQKQRIAILRALLDDSRVVIFDEAFSALDLVNEDLMMELVDKFTKDKVLIFVSHRSNKKAKFDQVIKL